MLMSRQLGNYFIYTLLLSAGFLKIELRSGALPIAHLNDGHFRVFGSEFCFLPGDSGECQEFFFGRRLGGRGKENTRKHISPTENNLMTIFPIFLQLQWSGILNSPKWNFLRWRGREKCEKLQRKSYGRRKSLVLWCRKCQY
jgi:hypothetical protein